MPDSNRRVVIEAATRFERSAVTESHIASPEMNNAAESLQHQLRSFCGYVIEHCDPRVIEAIQPEIDAGITARLVTDHGPDEPMERAGVYYVQGKKTPVPQLIVEMSAIHEASSLIGPLLNSSLEQNEVHDRLEAAVALVAWTSLADWVFGKIDPRNQPDFQRYSSAHIKLARMAGVSPDEIEDTSLTEQKIDDVLVAVEYRFVGSLGYAALINAADKEGNPILDKDKIATFHSMYAAFFTKQMKEPLPEITPLQFALAHPLSRREMHEVIQSFLDNS